MRLSTFKGALNGFIQIIFLGVLLSTTVEGAGSFHIKGAYDLDRDGDQEALLLNGNAGSLVWVEISTEGDQITQWSYSLPQGKSFNDAVIVDLNGDGYSELVAVLNGVTQVGGATDSHNWLYVFNGTESGFSQEPSLLDFHPEGVGIVNPSSLTSIPGHPNSLAVACGSPLRAGVILEFGLDQSEWTIQDSRQITAPIIQNGYAQIFIGAFTSDEGSFLTLITQETDQLKSAIFKIENDFALLTSEELPVGNAQKVMAADVQPYHSTASSQRGLLIPFGTDEVYLLTTQGDNQSLVNTSLSGQGAFPAFSDPSVSAIAELIDKRKSATLYESQSASLDAEPNPKELSSIPPPPPPVSGELASLKPKELKNGVDATSIPENGSFVHASSSEVSAKSAVANLTPTLGDYLASVKKDTPDIDSTGEKIAVPVVNEDMESVSWADEAGFEQVDLGQFVEEGVPVDTTSPIPGQDAGIATFSETAKESVMPEPNRIDSTKNYVSEDGVDLYYVLAMTPVGETKDRYVFDGEAPFGVAVNQVPATGEATHFQHGISANLANLNRGQTYDFAYSLRDARTDSITTLTMVHDMQTDVVFLSISPTEDSLSQSYQPEAFDPKLFEFPDYFFEGFPTSLDMDFTDKLIRFSFDGVADSTYHGIYLSATTPSAPPQSLAVFLDQGTLQAVRGEVVVRANGSKKATTEFDLIGHVEPALMFSQLIEENFPEDLKIKLLQGASLEAPLFGPNGNLPKISRERRLPDAEPSQAEPDVPVMPKQTHVPEGQGVTTDEKAPAEPDVPTPQEDNAQPDTFEPEKTTPAVVEPVESDTLKLEHAKDTKSEEGEPATPDVPQPEPEESRGEQN